MHGTGSAGAELGELARVGGDEFELYPENVAAVRLFMRVRRCWRVVATMQGLHYQGLEYGEVRAALELMAVPPERWPDLFDDLQVLEQSALTEIRLIEAQSKKR